MNRNFYFGFAFAADDFRKPGRLLADFPVCQIIDKTLRRNVFFNGFVLNLSLDGFHIQLNCISIINRSKSADINSAIRFNRLQSRHVLSSIRRLNSENRLAVLRHRHQDLNRIIAGKLRGQFSTGHLNHFAGFRVDNINHSHH